MRMHRLAAPWLALTLLLLAGCVQPRTEGRAPAPGRLDMDAAWGAWEDDPLPHLLLTLVHRSGSPIAVGPSSITVSGPVGPVPLVWSASMGARTLMPGETVEVALHPRAADEGTFSLALDHAAGLPMPPPPGEYFVCVKATCARASV